MNFNTAYFFWHGSDLELQERICLSSFVKHGFDVCLYSYEEMVVPNGVTLCDASEILSQEQMKMYKHSGNKSNIAAFSDVFRYKLIEKQKGWWFDADVLCLADSLKYIQLLESKQHKLSMGFQTEDIVAIGVLYIDDKKVTNELFSQIKNIEGKEFDWGTIGPKLMTKVIKDLGLIKYIDPVDFYYAIHYNEFRRLYDPEWKDWCKEKTKTSYAVHLWNEIRRVQLIPKNILPVKGSFLYEAYMDIDPELKVYPSIPLETLKALFHYYDIRYQYERLLDHEKRIKDIVDEKW
jgi:hypothetical protein